MHSAYVQLHGDVLVLHAFRCQKHDARMLRDSLTLVRLERTSFANSTRSSLVRAGSGATRTRSLLAVSK
jgi:hypothetical protein